MTLDMTGPTMPLPPEMELRFRIAAWEQRIATLEAENAAIKAWIAATFQRLVPDGDIFNPGIFRSANAPEGIERARAAWDALFGEPINDGKSES